MRYLMFLFLSGALEPGVWLHLQHSSVQSSHTPRAQWTPGLTAVVLDGAASGNKDARCERQISTSGKQNDCPFKVEEVVQQTVQGNFALFPACKQPLKDRSQTINCIIQENHKNWWIIYHFLLKRFAYILVFKWMTTTLPSLPLPRNTRYWNWPTYCLLLLDILWACSGRVPLGRVIWRMSGSIARVSFLPTLYFMRFSLFQLVALKTPHSKTVI